MNNRQQRPVKKVQANEESEKCEVSKRQIDEAFRSKEAEIKSLVNQTLDYQDKASALDKKTTVYKKKMERLAEKCESLIREKDLLKQKLDIVQSKSSSNMDIEELNKKSLSYIEYANEHRDELLGKIWKEKNHDKELEDLEKEIDNKYDHLFK